MTHDHDRVDREVIVTDGGGRGPGFVLAAIIAVLGVILVVWLFLNLGTENGGGEVIPDEVNIDVDDGTGGGGDGGGGDTGGGEG